MSAVPIYRGCTSGCETIVVEDTATAAGLLAQAAAGLPSGGGIIGDVENSVMNGEYGDFLTIESVLKRCAVTSTISIGVRRKGLLVSSQTLASAIVIEKIRFVGGKTLSD